MMENALLCQNSSGIEHSALLFPEGLLGLGRSKVEKSFRLKQCAPQGTPQFLPVPAMNTYTCASHSNVGSCNAVRSLAAESHSILGLSIS